MQKGDGEMRNNAQMRKIKMDGLPKLSKDNEKVHDCVHSCFFDDGVVHSFRLFYQD